jgi:hypothetical protein
MSRGMRAGRCEARPEHERASLAGLAAKSQSQNQKMHWEQCDGTSGWGMVQVGNE